MRIYFMVLIYISLIFIAVEHFFMCLFAISVSPSGKYLFNFSVQCLIEIFFYILSCIFLYIFLYVFGYQHLIKCLICKCLLPFSTLPFLLLLLVIFFTVPKFFSLMWSHSFSLLLLPLPEKTYPEKLLLYQCQRAYCICSPLPRIFVVSWFTLEFYFNSF